MVETTIFDSFAKSCVFHNFQLDLHSLIHRSLYFYSVGKEFQFRKPKYIGDLNTEHWSNGTIELTDN